MKHQLVIFQGVALALKGKVFGDDLALIVTEQPHKAEINKLAEETATLIAQSGDFDPLRELVTISRLITYLETIAEKIRDAATVEAEKFANEKVIDRFGAKIKLTKKPQRWEYGQCHAIQTRENLIETIKQQIKAIQNQLHIGTFIDPDTGEITPKATPAGGGTANIAITL